MLPAGRGSGPEPSRRVGDGFAARGRILYPDERWWVVRDVVPELARRLARGETLAVATVVSTWGSAPRPPGSVMLVDADGGVAGSVSGGCVDGDVHAVAEGVLASGETVLRRYGVSDEVAGAVGLTCGGTIEVLVQRLGTQHAEPLATVAAEVGHGRPAGVVTVVEHPEADRVGAVLVRTPAGLVGTAGHPRLDGHLDDDVAGALAAGADAVLTYGPTGDRQGRGVRVLVEALVPPARLVVVGVNDFAVALARIGAATGRRVTVCDARPVFAARAQGLGLEVVGRWPDAYLAQEACDGRLDRRTAVVVMTHDPKFDVPALAVALAQDVAFVGAMGSRRTHEDRLGRLRAAGVDEAGLARLRSPVGLDLGARTPEDTAVSVLAEVIAHGSGRTGAPLSATSGPIHAGRAGEPAAPGGAHPGARTAPGTG